MNGIVAILPYLKEISVGRASASNQALCGRTIVVDDGMAIEPPRYQSLAGAEVIWYQENSGKERPKDE